MISLKLICQIQFVSKSHELQHQHWILSSMIMDTFCTVMSLTLVCQNAAMTETMA